MIRRIANKIIHWSATQKYRIDLGFTMMTLFNFGLLILANSEKFQKLFPINTYLLVVIAVPFGIFIIWLMGYLMEVLKFRDRQNQLASFNNPVMMETLERIKRIEEKLNEKDNR